MNDYERGLMDALKTVLSVADEKRKLHMKNADSDLDPEDKESALNCSIVLGFLCGDIKMLMSYVGKKDINLENIFNAK